MLGQHRSLTRVLAIPEDQAWWTWQRPGKFFVSRLPPGALRDGFMLEGAGKLSICHLHLLDGIQTGPDRTLGAGAKLPLMSEPTLSVPFSTLA